MWYSSKRVKWQTNSGISRRQDCLHDTTQSLIYYPQMTDTPSAGCITPPFTGLFFSFLPFFFFLSFYAVKEVTHILLTFYQVFRIVTSHPESSRQSFTVSSRLPESWKLTSRELLICRRGGGVGCKAPCDHLWGKQWLASKYPLVSKSR